MAVLAKDPAGEALFEEPTVFFIEGLPVRDDSLDAGERIDVMGFHIIGEEQGSRGIREDEAGFIPSDHLDVESEVLIGHEVGGECKDTSLDSVLPWLGIPVEGHGPVEQVTSCPFDHQLVVRHEPGEPGAPFRVETEWIPRGAPGDVFFKAVAGVILCLERLDVFCDDCLVEKRYLLEVLRILHLSWSDAFRIEEAPVVRDAVVRVLDEPMELRALIGFNLFLAPPL